MFDFIIKCLLCRQSSESNHFKLSLINGKQQNAASVAKQIRNEINRIRVNEGTFFDRFSSTVLATNNRSLDFKTIKV